MLLKQRKQIAAFVFNREYDSAIETACSHGRIWLVAILALAREIHEVANEIREVVNEIRNARARCTLRLNRRSSPPVSMNITAGLDLNDFWAGRKRGAQ